MPHPQHDIWALILDLIGATSDLRRCSLVCQAWQALLQPRLMSSVLVSPYHVELLGEGSNVLTSIAPLVKKLNFVDLMSMYGLIKPLSRALFSHLASINFESITFEGFNSLRECVLVMHRALKSLTISECSCKDVRIIMEALKNDPPVALKNYMPPHVLALEDIHVDSDQIEYFAVVIWPWIANSPSLSTLKSLKIRFGYFDEIDVESLFAFVSHPECQLEYLHMVYGSYASDTLIETIRLSSMTIKHFHIAGDDENRDFIFLTLRKAALPSVESLHLHLPLSPDEIMEHVHLQERLTLDGLKHQYPSLSQMQLRITGWTDSPESTRTNLYTAIVTSEYLAACVKTGILTVEVFAVESYELSTEDQPSFICTPEQLAKGCRD